MLHLFFIMADKSKPSIFIELWKTGKRSYLHKCEHDRMAPSLTLPQVATLIWTPVYEESKQIVEELSSLSMSLLKVRKYPFPKEKTELEESLQNLCFVVNTCRSLEGLTLIDTGKQWLKEAVDRILKCYTLCEYADAAEIIKQLQEALWLTGNFSIMEKVLRLVSINHEYYMVITSFTNRIALFKGINVGC